MMTVMVMNDDDNKLKPNICDYDYRWYDRVFTLCSLPINVKYSVAVTYKNN